MTPTLQRAFHLKLLCRTVHGCSHASSLDSPVGIRDLILLFNAHPKSHSMSILKALLFLFSSVYVVAESVIVPGAAWTDTSGNPHPSSRRWHIDSNYAVVRAHARLMDVYDRSALLSTGSEKTNPRIAPSSPPFRAMRSALSILFEPVTECARSLLTWSIGLVKTMRSHQSLIQ